jgi:hypothetical protein
MKETDKHCLFWKHQFGQWTFRDMVDTDTEGTILKNRKKEVASTLVESNEFSYKVL